MDANGNNLDMDAKYLSYAGKQIFDEPSHSTDNDPLDRDWVKTSFMVADSEINDLDDIANRYWSSASAKFTDTRLGCNIGINPRPQWTPYSDIRVRGRLESRDKFSITSVTANHGMGRSYSEGIDDPSQKIFMMFGVPQFSGLLNFLMRAFNREQTILARTGRAPTAWYTAGKVVGTAIAAVAFPMLTVTVTAGKAIGWLMGRQTSKFFTLKPSMHFYWSTVNLLVNNHAVNEGIFKRILSTEDQQKKGRPYTLDEDQMNDLAATMPDVFNGKGYFDVYAIANKAQRLANQLFVNDFDALNQGSATDWLGYVKRDNSGSGSHSSYISDNNGKASLAALLNDILMMGDYYTAVQGADIKQELDPRIDAIDGKPEQLTDSQTQNGYLNYADALWRDGSQFAVFRVDHTGSVSESFGNTTTESELAQKLNGISSQFQQSRFALADGNLLGGVGSVIDSAINGMMNVAMGVADGVTYGFAGLIPGLGGSGYMDIPKHWQSSSASLPRGTYTIQLISPYNNPISRMINIWIPFYMILAAALPRSTGAQSYTSPFYCQLYDRGRLQSRLAMIESLSITRGTSNLAFDTKGHALAIDLSFTVVDLSTIMHLPMSSGGLFESDMTMDDDNIAQDYLNVLAGMDIYSQIYPFPKAQLKATKLMMQFQQKLNSPAYHMSLFKNSVEDGLISDLTFGLSSALSRGFSAAIAGNAVLEGERQ